jgi:alpha,alpha-trehalase
MTAFAPLRHFDGYLPLEDYGLIGDGVTAALCGRDGTVAWLCVPQFDSPPLFGSLLDRTRGGAFTVAPDRIVEARQFYEPDTAILVTQLRSRTGVLEIRDALTFQVGADLSEDTSSARGELIRELRVIEGYVTVLVTVEPRGGAEALLRSGGFQIRWIKDPGMKLWLGSTFRLSGLRSRLDLRQGETVYLSLRWGTAHHHHLTFAPEKILKDTAQAWHRWMTRVRYDGPLIPLVRRSAITIKLLDQFENGAIIAAPTSSLPEGIGGVRNWDYRFAWVRDAAMSVHALRQIGLDSEADGFVGWVLDTAEQHKRTRVVYTIKSDQVPEEQEDRNWAGYRNSRPVRWGNGAAEQHQHDVYGEMVDCAYQWARQMNRLDRVMWARVRRLVESAHREWREPDHGIWEVKRRNHFTYSIALCQVALDRGAWLADRFQLAGDVAAWRREAETICQVIVSEAWNPRLRALAASVGGDELDSSVLALPHRRVVAPDHPRMTATVEAVRAHLGAGNGLLYRFSPDKPMDELPGREGAFLICSFWMVDNLALQGRLDEAIDLYDSLCRRASPLGLFSEQIDPTSGLFLGNYPQALSHIGLIASSALLTRLLGKTHPNSSTSSQ